MAESVILWIFGGLISVLTLIAVAGVRAHNDAVQRLVKLEVTVDFWGRTFERMGEKALKMLHSPDDHLGLDTLVDEYNKSFDLPLDKWLRLNNICQAIIDDDTKPKEERTLALLSIALCTHKLSRYPQQVINEVKRAMSIS